VNNDNFIRALQPNTAHNHLFLHAGISVNWDIERRKTNKPYYYPIGVESEPSKGHSIIVTHASHQTLLHETPSPVS
jgi:hypothetical protein